MFFKNRLDEKVESLSYSLVSRIATATQKLSGVAEAEKLKFAGNKDQFIFDSDLCGTFHEVSNLLAAKKTEKAEEKLAELRTLNTVTRLSSSPTKVKQIGSLSRSTRQRNLQVTPKTKNEFVKHRKEPRRRTNRLCQGSRTWIETRRLALQVFRATNDDRTRFRGIVLALSLYFNRQVLALCLPLHCCSVFHASAYWRRKIIFLRTNVVRKTDILSVG